MPQDPSQLDPSFDYAKLPDGSYAKFKKGTSQEQMRTKLTSAGLLPRQPGMPAGGAGSSWGPVQPKYAGKIGGAGTPPGTSAQGASWGDVWRNTINPSLSAGSVMQGLGQGFTGAIQGLGQLATYPMRALTQGPQQTFQREVAQPAQQQWQQAQEAWRQGGAMKAAAGGHALAAGIPFVGPGAAHSGERLGRGDIGGGLGEIGGTILGAQAIGAAGRAPKAALEGVRAGRKFYQDVQATRGLTRAVAQQSENLGISLSKDTQRMNALDAFSQVVHNRIRGQLEALQETFKSHALASMRPLIEADRTNSKPVYTEAAAREAADVIKLTDYKPTPQEQAILDKLGGGKEAQLRADLAQRGLSAKAIDEIVAKEVGPKGLNLEQAMQLRSAARRAMNRANTPASQVMTTRAYSALSDAIRIRTNEIQGLPEETENDAWNQYNQNFRARFENMDKESWTSRFLDDPLDQNTARDQVKGFGDENLTTTAKQLADKGMDPRELYRLQQDAQRATKMRNVAAGKVGHGLMRMLSSPRAYWMPIAAYVGARAAGAYGLMPFLAAAAASEVSGPLTAMSQFGDSVRRLGLPEDVINAAHTARTQPGGFRQQYAKPQPAAPEAPSPAPAPAAPKPAPAPAAPAGPKVSLLEQVRQAEAAQAAKRRAVKPRVSAAEAQQSIARQAEATRAREAAAAAERAAAREEQMRARQRGEMETIGERQRLTPEQLRRRSREQD